MKKSNAFILAFIAFVLGAISGLLYASFKGQPAIVAGRGGHAPQMESPAQQDDNDKIAQLKEQLKAVERQLADHPGDSNLYVQAGHLSFDTEDYEKAIEYYDKAIQSGLNNANLLTDLGIAYRRIGKPEKAVEYFKTARQTDPKHETSALNLGIVLFHDLNDRQGAVEAWKEYLALNPAGERADMIRRVMAQLEAAKNPK